MRAVIAALGLCALAAFLFDNSTPRAMFTPAAAPVRRAAFQDATNSNFVNQKMDRRILHEIHQESVEPSSLLSNQNDAMMNT